MAITREIFCHYTEVRAASYDNEDCLTLDALLGGLSRLFEPDLSGFRARRSAPDPYQRRCDKA